MDRLSAGSEAPGGGSAAALTVAFAAGLVAMVARCSKEWEEAGGIAAQALALQARAAPLAHADAEAWEDALSALRRAGAGGRDDGGARRDHALERKLERAADVPLEIAALGADTAELAVVAAERCDGAYRADAAAAAALAAGGARAAAHLVEVNLGVRAGDERLARARGSEQAAAEAADRLLAAIR
ncbi:MAG: cyclodeaminase/cyclohydrolase family protein [Actinobacteria bacterium]|nr:cyclodeaminase/cyclohydrolase family protein [Actinomycetota bacterium]